MNFITKIISAIWVAMSGKEEIERLENEIRRLHQEVERLQMQNMRLKKRIEANEQNEKRKAIWDQANDSMRADILKSRFAK